MSGEYSSFDSLPHDSTGRFGVPRANVANVAIVVEAGNVAGQYTKPSGSTVVFVALEQWNILIYSANVA